VNRYQTLLSISTCQSLKLKSGEPLSIFAFNFNLRRYQPDGVHLVHVLHIADRLPDLQPGVLGHRAPGMHVRAVAALLQCVRRDVLPGKAWLILLATSSN